MKIRLAGLALLALSAAALFIFADVAALPVAERSHLVEAALAATGVLAEMLGLPMLLLGAGLFAPAPAPRRPRHSSPDKYSNSEQPPGFTEPL
jgi:hypothetical protein